jgi:hypothetical protein
MRDYFDREVLHYQFSYSSVESTKKEKIMPMHNRNLPVFAKRDYNKVSRLATDILTAVHAEKTTLVQLTEFNDGHFRAIFKSTYFVVSDEKEQPSKSQWNTLKKKFKRHDNRIFVFKEYGILAGKNKDTVPNFYIDFGFFAE